jgi:DNA-binding response OmpR family regulator
MPGHTITRKILIVEDEPTVADTLATIFRTRGYETRVAYRAEVALEIIAGWQPDAAVVDVMLPGMNGIDFAVVLRQKFPRCGVLLFSGQPDTSRLLDEALRKGHRFEVLAKPLHPSLILDKLAKLLGVEDPS